MWTTMHDDTVMVVVAVSVLLLAATALGVALWSAARVKALQRRLMNQEMTVLSLRGALSALCTSEMAVDQRQAEMAQRLQMIAGQQEQMLLRDPDQGPYQHAIRLAVRGASREQLMETCGLTRGEADLLLFINQPPQDSSLS